MTRNNNNNNITIHQPDYMSVLHSLSSPRVLAACMHPCLLPAAASPRLSLSRPYYSPTMHESCLTGCLIICQHHHPNPTRPSHTMPTANATRVHNIYDLSRRGRVSSMPAACLLVGLSDCLGAYACMYWCVRVCACVRAHVCVCSSRV